MRSVMLVAYHSHMSWLAHAYELMIFTQLCLQLSTNSPKIQCMSSALQYDIYNIQYKLCSFGNQRHASFLFRIQQTLWMNNTGSVTAVGIIWVPVAERQNPHMVE